MGTYVKNMETGKLEMHFDKSEYMALTDEQKKGIKSNFLFSRYSSAWVSRAKYPHYHTAEKIAEKLGLENAGATGERLTFEEQQERKADRAEARADRYDAKADRATERGNALQAPIDRMHGDIAFFTQPNINTSAGRAFTRKRDRMWSAWEKGMEEFKKSDYYRDRAETARRTAQYTRPTDKAFCQRRIDDAQKDIRSYKRTIDECNSYLKQIDAGETPRNKYGWEVDRSRESLIEQIERCEDMAEQATEKAIYYQACIDDMGGIEYSKDNLKPGYIVKVKRWGNGEVLSCGTKNAKIRFLDNNWTWACAYAEIIEIVEAKEKIAPEHPFKVGEEYTVDEWNGETYAPKTYKITKLNGQKVTLKSGTDRAISRTPRMGSYTWKGYWVLNICDGQHGYVLKKAE